MLKIYFPFLLLLSLSLFAQNESIHIKNTGINMTVAILTVDSFIEFGDTIVALYKIDDLNYKYPDPYVYPNNFGVAGLTVWKGERLAIALWGNDSTSDKKDGFLNNEFIHWAIVKNNQYIPVHMIYKVGNNYWSPNGISIIDSVKIGC